MVQNLLFFVIFLVMFLLMYNNYYNGVSYFLGVDLISYGLILLRVWICSLILISRELVFKLNNYIKYFLILILFLLIILVLTFRSINIFLFYVFFERRLIPTLFLILGWGYQPERLQAGIYLLFYTLLASLPLLISIFFILNRTLRLNMYLIINYSFYYYFFYLSIIFAFLVKIPIFLVHL
jgi:NADH-ubiquinone oxidoreductase chain 4